MTGAAALKAHIEDGLLPLWLERGWDDRLGLFAERLDERFRPLPLGFHRAMVCARQMFVYSRAFARTGEPRYAEVAHRLYEALSGPFWDGDHGGWFFSVGGDGAPKDTRKDLYAQAFGLFALAQYHGVFGEAAALDLAGRADEVVTNRLKQPGGWLAAGAGSDWSGAPGALVQNPHMHLLEGMLSLLASTGDAHFRDRARWLSRLCLERLADPGAGVVREYFDAQARPDGEIGRIVEPGHQFEWHWLLHEHADLTGDEAVREAAERMFAWAMAHGVDEAGGGIFDKVDPDGAVLEDSKRIWPVGECVKACATRDRRAGLKGASAATSAWMEFLARAYLRRDGGWHEHLDRALRPVQTVLPTSTIYHLVAALLEIERLETGTGVFVFRISSAAAS